MIPLCTFGNLPRAVELGGTAIEVNYGYRAMMAVEMEMFGQNNDEQKLFNALNIFYNGRLPDRVDSAVDALLWFHRCGAEKGSSNEATHLRKAKRAYCFKQDAPLVYAAFRQQYSMDLCRLANLDLHWWEFSALFDGLDENTKLAKVMYWRTCDLGGLPSEQKKYVKKMRGIYAIKEPEGSLDGKARLLKRNLDMKEYVRKRMDGAGKRQQP